MEYKIELDSKAETPIYLQIVSEIERLVDEDVLKQGSQLPAINELHKYLNVGRVTVVNAYNELKKRRIISSTQGKGFYISGKIQKGKKKVFLLFDALNDYKEILYTSFVTALGKEYIVDVFFHYYNKKQFKRFIEDNINDYDHYVVLPHFNTDVGSILACVPKDKLLLMDSSVSSLTDGYAAIYQNFEKDVYQCLQDATHLFSKYKSVNLLKEVGFQFIPDGIISGFCKYCEENELNYKIVENFSYKQIQKHEAYLAISNSSLITLIQYANENNWEAGSDLGIITYDDTPLKSILQGGITVITTDFNYMGKMAARMIKERIYSAIENPSRLIIRKSL